jgi:hypothetical protein
VDADVRSFHGAVKTEDVIVAGLRIGHTLLTQGRLLRGDPVTVCDQHGVPFTVQGKLIL